MMTIGASCLALIFSTVPVSAAESSIPLAIDQEITGSNLRIVKNLGSNSQQHVTQFAMTLMA
jgi:hypothetical protein